MNTRLRNRRYHSTANRLYAQNEFPHPRLLILARGSASADDGRPPILESKIRPPHRPVLRLPLRPAKKLKASLYLDNREAALNGGESGPPSSPGAPEKSRSSKPSTTKNPDLQLPPKDKLSDNRSPMTTWVKWRPGEIRTAPPPRHEKAAAFDLQNAKQSLGLATRQPQALPAVKDTAWPKEPESTVHPRPSSNKTISPAPPADQRTLLRRLYFDLIGLPPKPEEIDDFLNDPAPNRHRKSRRSPPRLPALRRALGPPLARPRPLFRNHGPRVRLPHPSAWRYRDYVHPALMRSPDRSGSSRADRRRPPRKPRRLENGDNESILGTAFWFMGEDVQAP